MEAVHQSEELLKASAQGRNIEDEEPREDQAMQDKWL